jgi:hypothetical protein
MVRTGAYWNALKSYESLQTGREVLLGRYKVIYTTFEGTSEIQRLIITRAISGVYIK